MTAAALYFAAPLFTPWERSFNVRIAAQLEETFSVFLPQRDGILLPGTSFSSEEYVAAAGRVFEGDVVALRSCTMLFAVLDGRTIDEGVAFELGFARALGKRCIGYRTDTRVLLPYGINPMVAHALEIVLDSEESLANWLVYERGSRS